MAAIFALMCLESMLSKLRWEGTHLIDVHESSLFFLCLGGIINNITWDGEIWMKIKEFTYAENTKILNIRRTEAAKFW
jgi:hypothetical protein